MEFPQRIPVMRNLHSQILQVFKCLYFNKGNLFEMIPAGSGAVRLRHLQIPAGSGAVRLRHLHLKKIITR